MGPNQILESAGSVVGTTLRVSTRLGLRVARDAVGLGRRAAQFGQTPDQTAGPAPKPDMDDVTLARKVESEIFRADDAPKGAVDVNVVDGVVWLRGEVKHPEQIRELQHKAESVPEVQGVENLLHLPKTPAPTRVDTPERQQRTRSSTTHPTPRHYEGRVTDDRTDDIVDRAEASPVEHAEQGEGRSPAPLGSDDSDDVDA